MTEAILERKGAKDEGRGQGTPPTLPLPTTTVTAGSKQDVFSLDEGQIVLQWTIEDEQGKLRRLQSLD